MEHPDGRDGFDQKPQGHTDLILGWFWQGFFPLKCILIFVVSPASPCGSWSCCMVIVVLATDAVKWYYKHAHTHKRDIQYPYLKKSNKQKMHPPPNSHACTHIRTHTHTHTHAHTHTHTNQQTIPAPSPEEEYSTTSISLCVQCTHPLSCPIKSTWEGRLPKYRRKMTTGIQKVRLSATEQTNNPAKTNTRKTEGSFLLHIQTFLADRDCLGCSVCSHSNHVVDGIPMLGPTTEYFWISSCVKHCLLSRIIFSAGGEFRCPD